MTRLLCLFALLVGALLTGCHAGTAAGPQADWTGSALSVSSRLVASADSAQPGLREATSPPSGLRVDETVTIDRTLATILNVHAVLQQIRISLLDTQPTEAVPDDLPQADAERRGMALVGVNPR